MPDGWIYGNFHGAGQGYQTKWYHLNGVGNFDEEQFRAVDKASMERFGIGFDKMRHILIVLCPLDHRSFSWPDRSWLNILLMESLYGAE